MANYLPFVVWGKQLNLSSVKYDFIAGLTGAFLVIPQGIAYALIAGLPPAYGLYAAIIPAVIAALFGSSLHMVSGPTAALSIVSAIVVGSIIGSSEEEYIALMLLLSLMVGVFQLAFAICRLGGLVNFISHSVVQGFTSGAALIIGASQLSNFLGLSKSSGPGFIAYILPLITSFSDVQLASVLVGGVTLFSAVLFKYYFKGVPYLLGSMFVGSFYCYFLYHDSGVAADIQMISALPKGMPEFVLPPFEWSSIVLLSSGALSIAILGLIEAVSIARSIAMRSKQLINGNQEFYGQGLSNLIGAFFQCYPSSGSFTRSGGNFDANAKTPLSVVFSALFVFLVLFFIPDITQFIPVPVMAGSILIIAWNLFDWRGFLVSVKSSKSESIPFFVTFISTLILQLEYAIYVGIVASLIIYLARTSRPNLTVVAPYINPQGRQQIKNASRYDLLECPEIKIIRLDGSLFFGAAHFFQKSLRHINDGGLKRTIVICKGVNFIDSSGQHALAEEIQHINSLQGHIFFSSIKGNTYEELSDPTLLTHFNNGMMKASTNEAISDMIKTIPSNRCFLCTKKVFDECPGKASHSIR